MPKSLHRTPQEKQQGDLPTRNDCIIYCRVSSKKQITQGDGLGSQENSCRNYAAMRGYEVLDVFTDGITGGTEERKGLQGLLAFLEQESPGIVVIIDDIKRFAREVEIHFALRRALTKAGARLESPLFRFEDTPEGKFIETMMAAQAELERNQNKRQVLSRMKARLEQGFWVFAAPPGYIYKHHPLAKKVLISDENAPVIREALEGFASGRFHSIADVDRFLLSRGFFGQKRTFRGSRLTRILDILSNAVYAGWLQFLPWGITLRKGYHKGLITFETYERIQERLQKRSTLRTEDVKQHIYPLRGIVLCEGCMRRLTASHSRGRQGTYYNYYHCPYQSCPHYGKSIPCGKLEDEFARLLTPLVMDQEQYDGIEAWLERQNEHQVQVEQAARKRFKNELEEIETRVGELIETISKTRSEVVLRSLEGKVEELSQQKDRIMARLHEVSLEAPINVGNMLERVGGLLRNPLLVWKTGDTKIRHLIAKVAFTGFVVYSRETGFGTLELSLPYRIFHVSTGGRSALVDPRRPFSNPESEDNDFLCVREVIRELMLWDQLLSDLQVTHGEILV